MRKKLTVDVFTSIRSEYGPLRPVLRALSADSSFNLRLLAGGAHLSAAFGRTISEIEADGFHVAKRLPFLSKSSRSGGAGQELARLQRQISAWFATSRPDLLLVLGDRFELMPVVTCALVESIPVAHISGGEVTEGAIDNQIRHAVTKMAHLHFPATEVYRQNLRHMGEEDWRICVSGEPSLDDVLAMTPLSREETFQDMPLPLSRRVACATFHPVTIGGEVTPDFVDSAFRVLLADTDLFFVVTAANFDSGGREINDRLAGIAAANSTRMRFVQSLGKHRYYSLLRFATLVLGNSSSGLIETQSFQVPTVDVGKRQQGRLANPNVLHVPADPGAILAGVRSALGQDFRAGFAGKPNIYGDGHAAPRIVEFIRRADFDRLLLKRDVFG